MNPYDISTIEQRRAEVVTLARSILAGRIGVLEGAKRMLAYRFAVGVDEWDSDFLTFVSIESQEDHLPVGSVRQHWDAEALAKAEREISEAEQFHRAAAVKAAESLLRRFSPVPLSSGEQGDAQLVRSLMERWYARRADVERLVLERFDLDCINDVLRLGRQTRPLQIPGTDWYCWVHGIGVRVTRGDETGGIDFDLDKPDPDPWRLWIFAQAQVEEQSEDANRLRELADDLQRIERAFVMVSGG